MYIGYSRYNALSELALNYLTYLSEECQLPFWLEPTVVTQYFLAFSFALGVPLIIGICFQISIVQTKYIKYIYILTRNHRQNRFPLLDQYHRCVSFEPDDSLSALLLPLLVQLTSFVQNLLVILLGTE